MKITYLLLPIFLILLSCSSDDVDYATIDGKVERTLNGDGIPNQKVLVMTSKRVRSGMLGSVKELDRAEVITDADGNFSTSLVVDSDAFISIVHEGDDEYSGSGIVTDYPMGQKVVIKTDKYIKFKIAVKNTDPIDENDFIHIELFGGLLSNVVRTGIENFGVENTQHPKQQLPGGGAIGAWEETSWTGTNVSSNVYYSVGESAEWIKIRWFMKKGGIETDGYSDDIPYDINQVNPFSFDY